MQRHSLNLQTTELFKPSIWNASFSSGLIFTDTISDEPPFSNKPSAVGPAAFDSDLDKAIDEMGQLGWSRPEDSEASSYAHQQLFQAGAAIPEIYPGDRASPRQQQRQPPRHLLSSAAVIDDIPDCFGHVQRPTPPQLIGGAALQPAKLSIGHEIDKWIASVSCCAPLPPTGAAADGHRQELGPNRIAVDKATLLAFLAKLKMHYQKKREMRIELCAFCRQNQEPFHVYTSHRLADINGNVTCPVLFRYVCPICGASGSKAHTIKYCPLGNGGQNLQTQRQRLQSVTGF